jgi:membrane-associated phospholipid phosphatase
MIRTALALSIFASAVAASTAAAQEPHEHRLEWSDDWARTHPISYALTGTAVATALFFDFLFDPGPEALVRGPAAFDGYWRARLMAPGEEDRERAAMVSDVLVVALLAWPWLDAWGSAGIGDQNSDVTWQLSTMNAEVFALDLLFSTLARQLVARERPHGERCSEGDRARYPESYCGPRGRLRSFYSGHASGAFSSAGLVCMHHAHVPLWGSPEADALACGTALLIATIVATLRVVADRHHATDVIVGGLVGLAIGTLVPWGLHYAIDPTPDEAMTSAPLTRAGFGYGGVF